jgi:heterodisulfide reductase subunit A
MSRLIKQRHPETEITFFYMDVQTFGKDFEPFYEETQKEIRMIRAIPGDIYETDGQHLKVNHIDNHSHKTLEEIFDLVVLSIGITPCEDIQTISGLLGIEPDDTGFVKTDDKKTSAFVNGVFAAGTVQGPMSIADTIASAGSAAWKIARYLGLNFS